jgi:DNA-binding response OmpR family regulator
MPGRLVVIADRDHGLRRVLEAALTVQHFRTVTASDAAQTMELARHERPELIVASVGTPRTDGFAVIQQLKSDPATASIPVLAVTGVPSLDLQQRARAAGVDALLIRPITATTLSDVAHMLIERAALLQARSERLLAHGAIRHAASGDAPSSSEPTTRAASPSVATPLATPRCRRCGSDAQCTLVRTTRSSVTYHCGACGHTWRLTFKTPPADA